MALFYAKPGSSFSILLNTVLPAAAATIYFLELAQDETNLLALLDPMKQL